MRVVWTYLMKSVELFLHFILFKTFTIFYYIPIQKHLIKWMVRQNKQCFHIIFSSREENQIFFLNFFRVDSPSKILFFVTALIGKHISISMVDAINYSLLWSASLFFFIAITLHIEFNELLDQSTSRNTAQSRIYKRFGIKANIEKHI